MKSVLVAILLSVISAPAFAEPTDPAQEAMAAICEGQGYFYAVGQLRMRGQRNGHVGTGNIIQNKTDKNHMIVTFNVTLSEDGLMSTLPNNIGFNCFRCSDEKVVVSSEGTAEKACIKQ